MYDTDDASNQDNSRLFQQLAIASSAPSAFYKSVSLIWRPVSASVTSSWMPVRGTQVSHGPLVAVKVLLATTSLTILPTERLTPLLADALGGQLSYTNVSLTRDTNAPDRLLGCANTVTPSCGGHEQLRQDDCVTCANDSFTVTTFWYSRSPRVIL